MGAFLTKEQRAELLNKLHSEKDLKYADRIRVILLLDEEKPVSEIAEYFFLHEKTVKNYQDRYKNGGLEGLIIDDRPDCSSHLSIGASN